MDTEHPIISKIQKRVEEISLILMNHENKNYCLARVHPNNWHFRSYRQGNICVNVVIVPSPAFTRLIIHNDYVNIVKQFPDAFGTENDRNIIRAIKDYDRKNLLREYSDEEFFEFIRGETMAYVFKIENNGALYDRVLRLDLCRNINYVNEFQGGLFHVFKHFTPNGLDTISSFKREYKVNSFSEIFKYVILNFFSDDFSRKDKFIYVATSNILEGKILKGFYYKQEEIPVFFVNSFRKSE